MAHTVPERRSGRPLTNRPLVIGGCVIFPVMLILCVVLVVWNNNRPVHVAVPTPKLPDPNAYDDLVRAGIVARGVQHKSPYSMPQPIYTFAAFKAAAGDAA